MVLISLEHLSSICKKVLFYIKRNHHIFGRPVLFSQKYIQMLYFGTQSFFMLLDKVDIYLAPALTLFHKNIINSELYITVDTFQLVSLYIVFSSSFVLLWESARSKKGLTLLRPKTIPGTIIIKNRSFFK